MCYQNFVSVPFNCVTDNFWITVSRLTHSSQESQNRANIVTETESSFKKQVCRVIPVVLGSSKCTQYFGKPNNKSIVSPYSKLSSGSNDFSKLKTLVELLSKLESFLEKNAQKKSAI